MKTTKIVALGKESCRNRCVLDQYFETRDCSKLGYHYRIQCTCESNSYITAALKLKDFDKLVTRSSRTIAVWPIVYDPIM